MRFVLYLHEEIKISVMRNVCTYFKQRVISWRYLLKSAAAMRKRTDV